MGTIQQAIDDNDTISAVCDAYGCHHHRELDLKALRDRLGPDHGVMHDDLTPLLRCSKCGSRNVSIRVSPNAATRAGGRHPL